MSGAFRFVALAFVLLLLSLMLKEIGFRGAKLFSAVGFIGLYALLLDNFATVFSEMTSLTEVAGLEDCAKDIMKVVGVGYVFGITSDMCQDLGEGSIASVLNAAGRVEIIALTLPFIKRIVALAGEVIK